MRELPLHKTAAGQDRESCCGKEADRDIPQLQPIGIPIAKPTVDDDTPCCGPKPGPPSSPFEKPGYRMLHFVRDFSETEIGPVPEVATTLKFADFAGTIKARLGIFRHKYRVSPGLYCVGKPGADSPILVTANYKLSFDSLRQELASVDAWILVLDTRGVNVWCAAAKRTFSTQEVIRQVNRAGLEKLVSHRGLILPQLGAPGVSAQEVKKGCGFKVIWGPIRAEDLKTFLSNGYQAETGMRRITFSIGERIILIPVELSLIVKPSLAILLAVFVISGISPEIFSLSAAWFRGLHGAASYLYGLLAGAIAVPILLPWLPVKQFYIKGMLTGLLGGIFLILSLGADISRLEAVTMLLLTTAVSSYAAMNFTGATPYTSPSGVEKEMRQGIPIQVIALVGAIVTWVAAPFIN